jgi:uncharacterized protein
VNQQPPIRCTAFAGFQCVATGELPEVAVKVKAIVDQPEVAAILIFDDATGRPVEVNFRGTADDVLRRLVPTAHQENDVDESASVGETARGPGRPKLGVVAREVTLLPRHWEWLGSQPGGASVALRKLVEHARRANEGRDRVRLSQEAANRFMGALGGDLAGYEEATRALFAGNRQRFDELIEPWPSDVRDYAKKLAAAALTTCDSTDE